MIEQGKQVAIEYSVSTDNQNKVDSNVGQDPLIFLYGGNQILPALEESLHGLEIGDTKHVILGPEDAYGIINTHAFKEVDAGMIPEELRFPGALLSVTDEQFGEMLIQVRSFEGDKIVLDFNHPLAGKTLFFDVKVLDIQ